ncbi:MAG: hypothetical protein B7Z40_11110 [Bosea sp. 12-68-7]|nr:MAG: hypothetical protein B7Z40_11110 [Bosea sp. 12-68-7]
MLSTKRGLALAALGLLVAPTVARAQALPRVQVWRDAGCGCCGGWVEHMRAAGFPLEDNIVQSVAAIRRRLRTPSDLLSCHAALVDGYVLEGHVPAAAVKRLETYDIIAFDGERGRMSFMRFRGGEPV